MIPENYDTWLNSSNNREQDELLLNSLLRIFRENDFYDDPVLEKLFVIRGSNQSGVVRIFIGAAFTRSGKNKRLIIDLVNEYFWKIYVPTKSYKKYKFYLSIKEFVIEFCKIDKNVLR